MSTVYAIAAYLGWLRILEKEAFIEFLPSHKKATWLNIQVNRTRKALNSRAYFEGWDAEGKKGASACVVHGSVLTVVGELMIRTTADGRRDVLDLVEFSRVWKTEEFSRWLAELDRVLLPPKRDHEDPAWNRLLVFAIQVRALLTRLDSGMRHTTPRRVEFLDRLHPETMKVVKRELSGMDVPT